MARCNLCGSYIITTADIEALRFAHKDPSYGHPDPVGEQGTDGEVGVHAKCARAIFEDIENNYADFLFDGCRNIVVLTEKDFSELKKKYTESAAEK